MTTRAAERLFIFVVVETCCGKEKERRENKGGVRSRDKEQLLRGEATTWPCGRIGFQRGKRYRPFSSPLSGAFRCIFRHKTTHRIQFSSSRPIRRVRKRLQGHDEATRAMRGNDVIICDRIGQHPLAACRLRYPGQNALRFTLARLQTILKEAKTSYPARFAIEAYLEVRRARSKGKKVSFFLFSGFRLCVLRAFQGRGIQRFCHQQQSPLSAPESAP